MRTSSKKVCRASLESDVRTVRDRQDVMELRADRPADSTFSLAVWNTCGPNTSAYTQLKAPAGY